MSELYQLMASKTINFGDLMVEGEPPLRENIAEDEVSFQGVDGKTITGLLNYPKNKPITQKSLFLHEIEGLAAGGTLQVIARHYAEMGIAVLRIDFKGHGKRKREWKGYSPKTMLNDALSSIDFLDEQYPRLRTH